MEIRQKIKAEEAWIRKLLRESKSQSSPAYRAWDRLLNYYIMYDFLEGHNHVALITYIYQSKHALHETIYCFAWKHYIGERTLYRYRKKYILCFKRYYEEELKQEKIANGQENVITKRLTNL